MPEKKLRIGILFNFNPSWMGGIIYILNLIRTLDFLDETEKPEILLFYRSDLKKFADQIKYPHLTPVQWTFPSVYKGYIKSWFLRKNCFISDIIGKYDLDGIYPLHDYPVRTRTKTRLVCWYADLQHKYYPGFFTRKKLFERNLRIRFIMKNSDHLVVSSQAVADDFMNFFRINSNLKIHVYHFVSIIDDLSGPGIDDLRKKYSLPVKYFMVSNQFHRHKNHRILLKSLISLNNKGHRIHLAMTGRFPEASHSPYMQELHYLIKEFNLQSQISMLGIIDRNEQLLLMKHSLAVLQPSLFEGWSTVIEDAISLRVPVIASSIPVNIEQLGNYGIFFDPHDHENLADILENFADSTRDSKFYPDYKGRIRNAAQIFIKIFQD